MSQPIPRQQLEETIVPMPLGRDPIASYPFYCVHSISGNAIAEFRHLASCLAPDIAFFAIQVPKAQRTEATGSSLLAMATHYCDLVVAHHREHFADKPFALGGWSAGSIVALEMAQQLKKLGHAPQLLIAIDKCPRHTRAEIGDWNSGLRNVWLWLKRSWRNSDTWGQAARSLASKFWLIIRHRQLYGGPDSEYSSAAVIADLTKSARSVNERAFISAFYARTTAYIPSSYHGRVLILVTKDGYKDRVIEGWREIARDLVVVRIPGSHMSAVMGRRLAHNRRDLDDVRALAVVLRSELRMALG